MTDAASQIVGRLRSLGVRDREWVLCQLSIEERQQVLAVLTANDANTGIPESGVAPEDDRDRGMLPAGVSANQSTITPELIAIENAKPGELAALLAEQTDWTVVVLLAAKDWSWTESLLGMLPPARLRALRELSNTLGNSVRPRVRDTVAGLVADQLRANAHQDGGRSIFDIVLERAERDALSGRPGSGDSM